KSLPKQHSVRKTDLHLYVAQDPPNCCANVHQAGWSHLESERSGTNAGRPPLPQQGVAAPPARPLTPHFGWHPAGVDHLRSKERSQGGGLYIPNWRQRLGPHLWRDSPEIRAAAGVDDALRPQKTTAQSEDNPRPSRRVG